MKSFRKFLNEGESAWKFYSMGSTRKLANLLKGEVKPVFSIIEIGDPEIAKYVSIFYDGYTDTYIVSEKINFTREHYERGKFLTFDFDEHSNHCYLCYQTTGAEETYLLAKLISFFGDKDNLDKYRDLIETIWSNIDHERSKYDPGKRDSVELTDFYSAADMKKWVLSWEDSFEAEVPSEILSKLGLPQVFINARKYGL